MQATQSSTASGSESTSGKFKALRHVTREMSLRQAETPGVRGLAADGVFHGADVAFNTDDAVFHVPDGMEEAAPVEDAEAIYGVAEGAGLAHDAGNLLGALSLYSDLLGMPGVLHEEHREYAAELRILSDRSWAMINRLVNHARGGQQARPEGEISVLPDVIDRCRGLLSRVAGRTVEVSYGLGAFQPVRVPVESVERIVTNLVKNAAEATPWTGAISIHVEGVRDLTEVDGSQAARRVVLTVRDRGCGMDQEAVRRLMQAGGISSASGRGLGFRVVRELVATSGGSLNVDSQPEVGTSISVEWQPARQDHALQDERRAKASKAEKKIAEEQEPEFTDETGWFAC